MTTDMNNDLYPDLEPYQSGWLEVDGLHQIYYEQSGCPYGYPVLLVHGGPGGGSSPINRKFFDPSFYRIIAFDQRGCGRSKPFLELKDNRTDLLAKDMEALRKHLSIDKWLLFGGSWGTTLSLYYGIHYPKSVSAMILRGIFLGRKEDVDWLYQKGSGFYFPEAFEDFKKAIDPKDQDDLIGAYYKGMTLGPDFDRLAKAFADYENSVVALNPRPKSDQLTDGNRSLALLECHYFVNHSFMEENFILNHAHRLADIPIDIIHGQYDMDCRPCGAYDLSKQLAKCRLIFPISGHATLDPEMSKAILQSVEGFKRSLQNNTNWLKDKESEE